MFKRVLIANRGEIAVRIARAAASLGIESVAVFTPADSLSLHTRLASTARAIGNAAADPVRPYLDVDAIIAAAKDSGSDCVHPGYGFLSENANFAQRCQSAGLRFIGPSPATLVLFGDKVEARAFAQSQGIPVVPGAPGALASGDEAKALAQSVGYPVMLKASAGGGGRGMRVVARAEEMDEAFARCQGEAQAAFGDGAVFLEKIVPRPRHIEVQVLGDGQGNVVHLHERDCSVQLRNQKVVEVAPAPNLDDGLRQRIFADALKLARAARFENAGTIEFLVNPESGEHFFIECNPRIQVEHTITEQVLGFDLLEAQFRIAAGATLAALGLASQQAVPAPRGFAIQARVVAQGTGTLSAYREPSGPGMRVDACGYVGLTPPPQFDPLLAKLISQSNSSGSFESAITRMERALDEFHVTGVPTNNAQLRAILAHPAFRAGDARTTLLGEAPMKAASASATATLQLLDQQAAALGRQGGTAAAPQAARPSLPVPDGHVGVESPQAGSVIDVSVREGEQVSAGATLFVVTAMKMETAVTAPSAGVIAGLAPLAAGDAVDAGQILAVIRPSADGGAAAARGTADGGWTPMLAKVDALRAIAHTRLAPQSQESGVVRQRNRGKHTCRERIDALLDPGSFREIGSLAGFASFDEDGEVMAFTPASHVGGQGRIESRSCIVCADDFTSRGGHADGAIGQKSRYLDRLSIEMRVPSIRLLDGSSGGGSVATMVPKQDGTASAKESTGAIKAGRPRVVGGGGSFLPSHLGSTMFVEQLATVPVVNMLLGSVVGIGAAKAVLGHFSVMVRDISQLFVAGPPVVSHAMGYEVTKEDLGGWQIHCRNGSVDNLAESEQDAIAMTRRFLSYLPASVYEVPPVAAPDPADPADRRDEALLTLIPRKRTATFDVRQAIRLMADKDSFFEVGPLWGTDQVAGFVRFNGHPMGVIASDSRHINGGALTADGCDKLRRHLDLCDLFHLPVLNLVDNPGFAVGIEHEIAGTIRKGGEWMVAFAQVNVPIFTVLMRRSFGVAGNNYATPRAAASVRVTWPAADVGGIPPEGGIEAAYKRQLAEAADPAALRAEIYARIESVRGPIGPLNRFEIEEMIDPRDTRRLICEWLVDAYRIIAQPSRLVPRALQFRP
ncbi:ATP-grasp domain-containing protein [Vineibacter terrae]|uniref:acetyl-CoA carboxylase n=1 Tax=Vineibacter terrae TaxID=2586908 RepID=A0A5C8PQL0_9HYPH|nr:carboxyl transferase domain-containing protein [Vineibacter terrae]TXL77208.1 ATP-grasp domain-containing protein [Vineibacter terrae]